MIWRLHSFTIVNLIIVVIIIILILLILKNKDNNPVTTNKISKEDVDLIAKHNNIPLTYYKFLTAQDKFIFYPDTDPTYFWIDIILTEEEWKDYELKNGAYFPKMPKQFFFIVDGKAYTGEHDSYENSGSDPIKKFRFGLSNIKPLNMLPTIKGTYSDLFGVTLLNE